MNTKEEIRNQYNEIINSLDILIGELDYDEALDINKRDSMINSIYDAKDTLEEAFKDYLEN